MSVTPLFSSAAFEPELIKDMSIAFAEACQSLGLKVGDDPATRLVAATIIEMAQRGTRGVENLKTMTLKEFSRQTG